MSQVGNSSGSVSAGGIGSPVASSGSQSSVPGWFNSMDWGSFAGSIASNLGASFGGQLGASIGGASGDAGMAGALGQAGAAVGG
jgi:hypothetical protein